LEGPHYPKKTKTPRPACVAPEGARWSRSMLLKIVIMPLLLQPASWNSMLMGGLDWNAGVA
jgi:hypothetical protein